MEISWSYRRCCIDASWLRLPLDWPKHDCLPDVNFKEGSDQRFIHHHKHNKAHPHRSQRESLLEIYTSARRFESNGKGIDLKWMTYMICILMNSVKKLTVNRNGMLCSNTSNVPRHRVAYSLVDRIHLDLCLCDIDMSTTAFCVNRTLTDLFRGHTPEEEIDI
jgi:hypothetical protein